MKAELHTTSAVFDILADEWDILLEAGRSEIFFMRHDWQRIWWKNLGQGTLSLVTTRDDNHVLRGIAPWFVTKEKNRHVLRVLGCVDVSDYIDLLLMAGHEKQTLASLLDFALSENMPDWDEMHLCNVPEDSSTLILLPELATSRGLNLEITVEDVCPLITLPETYEEYLSLLDKKQRHELRRKRRRAANYTVRWQIAGPEDNPDSEIEAFLELMAMSTPQKADFLAQPGHRSFFKEMGRVLFDKRLLELNFLVIGEQRVAALWNFVYQDRMMLYNSGLNPMDYSELSAGIVLLTFSIEDAIRRGLQYFDFLQGDETYKYRMGAKPTTVYNLVIKR